MKSSKKREKELKADIVMNRLMQDSEVRRKTKQFIESDNPNSYQEPLKYDTNLRNKKSALVIETVSNK